MNKSSTLQGENREFDEMKPVWAATLEKLIFFSVCLPPPIDPTLNRKEIFYSRVDQERNRIERKHRRSEGRRRRICAVGTRIRIARLFLMLCQRLTEEKHST